MSALRLFFAVLLAAVLAGCASAPVSLSEVRDFTDASHQLLGYGELSARFRDTYQREQAYLTPAADKLARETDARRRAAYEDFASLQKAAMLYMDTLGQLAGATRYDLSDRLDNLSTGLKSGADTGIEQRHLSAYTGLTRLLVRVIASNYQNRSVDSLAHDADPDLQAVLDSMATLLRYYAKTNDNEKKTVLGLFEVELPMLTRPQDRLLLTLAKAHYLNKQTEYKLVERRFALAAQGIAKVSLGHQQLRDHVHELSRDDVRAALAGIVRDLRLIHTGLTDRSLP